jgi:HD-like signal output (HDOD) protein/CheY-like chemotaxis protein
LVNFVESSALRISDAPANVLLVTDDPGVFDLRERLSDAHELWGVSSVPTAQKALTQLDKDSEIDAVVVGQRIADTDARSFLDALRTSFPDVARIAIAQSPTAAKALESARAVHGAVDYPVDAEALQRMLERTVTLRWRLNDPQLQQLFSEIDRLPTPPAAIVELSAALSEPQIEIGDVAKIVESDPSMTAKLLQVVNSASFGLSQRMTKVDQIVAYLGLSAVRNVLTATELLSAFHAVEPDLQGDIELHRLHAMAVAEVAQRLPNDRREQHEAFAAGMLHDIGLLALMMCAPARYRAVKGEVLAGREFGSSELDILGASHATIGAHLLEQWMLPTSICEAVARSHDADMMQDITPAVVHAVFIGEQFVSSQPEAAWWEPGSAIAPSYVASLGWTEAVHL